MLHKIPDSPLREALLTLVGIQRTLVEKLCALPEGSSITLDWLKDEVWPAPIDANWIDRFWSNDKVSIGNGAKVGRRQVWMETIARATVTEKRELLAVMAEQLDYAMVYAAPPRHITKTDMAYWKATPFRRSARSLLIDFYTPWLDARNGYPGDMLNWPVKVTRAEYLKEATPVVCPYCDTSLQTTEVDHFLPKSSFPFLSVHPDNFIPSCHDSNEFTSHKGERPPLDWDGDDQARDYFHPRLRPAIDRYTLSFRDDEQRLSLTLVAVDPTEQRRVDNLDAMFRITKDFWGKALETQVQDVIEDVSYVIRQGEIDASIDAVRDYLRAQVSMYRRFIGKRPLHIFYAHLYEFVAQDDELVAIALRTG